jgi:hypothetical protein
MARCGSQDLPIPMSEFRTLCAIFDEFLTFELENKTRYLVVCLDMLRCGVTERPLLFRETTQRIVRGGIPRRTTTTYVPVSPEEWCVFCCCCCCWGCWGWWWS